MFFHVAGAKCTLAKTHFLEQDLQDLLVALAYCLSTDLDRMESQRAPVCMVLRLITELARFLRGFRILKIFLATPPIGYVKGTPLVGCTTVSTAKFPISATPSDVWNRFPSQLDASFSLWQLPNHHGATVCTVSPLFSKASSYTEVPQLQL